MTPGLVSITFRKYSPREIIRACCESGLRAIEWGGDIHVPHGDVNTASQVGELTCAAGLAVAAYGSYYRLGTDTGPAFEDVLSSAVALAAPVIRVWAGNLGSADADSASRQSVIDDARRCADMSAARDIAIAYEFHAGTLTDTTESTLELLNATEHPFIKTLWQPPHGRPLPECVESLRSVAHRLQHIHVFHWWPDSSTRHPLCEGGERWTAYVQELRELGRECPLLLEFVCGDALDSFRDDARTLRELCGV